MAVKESPLLWRTFAADRVTLSEGGAVLTKTLADGFSLTTPGLELTVGQHSWEVALLSQSVGMIFIGISRPNLDPAGRYTVGDCTDSWFINASYGGLNGNGKECNDTAGPYKQGDRVGVLLDLDNGSLRFFKNGVEHGSGYAAGSVTGPVLHAVQLYFKDASVQLLPNAQAPVGY
jgi:hypothetical protein